MGMFTSFDVNASGMTAQRYRMDIISENIANANSTRTADGTPYRRKVVTFEEKGSQTPFAHVLSQAQTSLTPLGHVLHQGIDKYSGTGVKVSSVREDTWTEMNMVYDPSHPDADENGYVTYPNVDTITEMVNLIDASRSYEANATAFQASKAMAVKGLDISQ